MKFTIEGSHREFFEKNHRIEFESLLTFSQTGVLRERIHDALALRSKNRGTAEEQFNHGRDLWRLSGDLRKTIMQQRFSEIAYELMGIKPLRIAYDQYFPFPDAQAKEGSSYQNLICSGLTLQELSCVQGVVCGLMLCLSGEGAAEASTSLFSQKAGNGVFFDAKFPLDFKDLYQRQGNEYLMITYAHSSSVYILNRNDPHTHEFKNLGYNFGDKLTDKLHPIIYR